MDDLQVNERIKKLIDNLVERGILKTTIGKILLGMNNYTRMSRFYNQGINFGIKPLKKIAMLNRCELRLVFLDPKQHVDLDSKIMERNFEFFNEIEDGIVEYANNNITVDNEELYKQKKRSTLEDIVEGFLNSDDDEYVDINDENPNSINNSKKIDEEK